MNIEEWHDKSVRPQPRDGKSKRTQASLVDVQKDIYHVSRHQEQIIKELFHACHKNEIT